MRRALLALCLVVLCSPELSAKSPASPGAASERSASESILRREDEFARALVRRDEETFRRLLAPGFVYTENDQNVTRDALIRELVSGTDQVKAAHNEGMDVHRFGYGSVAVVTGWLVTSGRGAKGNFARRYRFTDVWQMRSGRWQLIAAHDYLAK